MLKLFFELLERHGFLLFLIVELNYLWAEHANIIYLLNNIPSLDYEFVN